jgi:voltage-gated potassium channel
MPLGIISERGMDRLNRAVVSGRIIPYLALMTLAVAAVGGVAAWLLSPEGFDGLGDALWWGAQTVTTVGYGDVAPTNVSGRLVGAFVMLEGTAFIAVVTALITSMFVTRAARVAEAARVEDELSDRQLMEKRFDELERLVASLAQTSPSKTDPR